MATDRTLLLSDENQPHGTIRMWPAGDGALCIRLQGHNEQDTPQYLTLVVRAEDVPRLRAFLDGL